jgi:hypothetical protein
VSDSLLDALVDDQLGSVTFVMDYVQLGFGNASFSAYVWPTVVIGDATLQLGDPGYRDAMCAFIGHSVTAAQESPAGGLLVRFALGDVVTNPEPTDMEGAEIAQLRVYDPLTQVTSVAVWRPGEGVFAGRDWS